MSFQFLSKPVSPLSFDEYIKLLPNDLVFKKLVKDSSLSRKILSSSMISELAETFSDPEDIRRRYDNLTPSSQLNCALVYLFKNNGLPAPPDVDFDDELLSSFLVYVSQDVEHRLCYYCFDTFADVLADRIADTIKGSCAVPPPSETQHPSHTVPWACLNDFVVICIFASRKLLKKTKNGALVKTSQNALERLLSGPLPMIDEHSIKAISLCIDYGLEKGILAFLNNTYLLKDAVLYQWLQRPLPDLHREFSEFCFNHSVHRPIIERICPSPGDPWISTGKFPPVVDQYLKEALLLLTYCDFIAQIPNENGISFTRSETFNSLSKDAPNDAIVVLPDFSAIIPGEIQPARLYDFTQIGNVASFDKVYKGNIEKSIINDSLARGADSDRLLNFLAEWNAPPNVVETIKEWIREFSRLFITSGSIIALRDNKISNQLTSVETIGDLLEPLDARKVFRIKEGYEDIVYSRLMELGFDPRIPSKPVFPQKSMKGFDKDVLPLRMPVTTFSEQKEESLVDVKVGKYGSEMKKLDISEMLNVVDYALLMGYYLIVDYAGSRNLKKSTYTFLPLSYQRSAAEPYLEGELFESKSIRKFYIDKINKLGVRKA
ncbi:MAG: hypothetical protein GF401_15075 [Chitinivibrionales bacterium]|nr:hypothetical protein [Chitinivibrionales bacterium]